MSRDHNKLKAFPLADALAVCIYRETGNFPTSERHGLPKSALQDSVSVPANIVEGSARTSERDYLRFLEIGLSSACGADYLIGLAKRLSFLSEEGWTRCKNCSVPTIKALQKLITVLSREPEA
jgi:four helix bundle protein